MSAALVVVLILLAVGSAVGLYVLVRAEHGRRARMGREDAERVARRNEDE